MTYHAAVYEHVHMREELGDVYREVLEASLLRPKQIAAETGRSHPTIRAYRYGYRDVTPGAARELAEFLRGRSQEFEALASKLEEAAMKAEEENG